MRPKSQANAKTLVGSSTNEIMEMPIVHSSKYLEIIIDQSLSMLQHMTELDLKQPKQPRSLKLGMREVSRLATGYLS